MRRNATTGAVSAMSAGKTLPIRLIVYAIAIVAAAPARAGESVAAERLLAAQGTLAARLIDRVATTTPGANVVVSPAGLASALAAIALGADAGAQRSAHTLLGFSASPSARADLEALRAAAL